MKKTAQQCCIIGTPGELAGQVAAAAKMAAARKASFAAKLAAKEAKRLGYWGDAPSTTVNSAAAALRAAGLVD